jgi:hypothetical protein
MISVEVFQDKIPPWAIAGTKLASDALGLDRCAFLMRRYRGQGPQAVPSWWVEGRSIAWSGVSLLHWLGDRRPAVAMYRQSLLDSIGADAIQCSEEEVRLLAAASAQAWSDPNIRLTTAGKRAHQQFILQPN